MQVANVNIYMTLLLSVNIANAQVFICNNDKTKVIKFEDPYCNVYTQKGDVDVILNQNKVWFFDDNFINDFEVPCNERKKHGFIFPGTLWCGRGTKARSFGELGKHSEEDKCCREHDTCPKSFLAGECRGGICNTSRFTRSHCDCDYKFQQCLRNIGTSAGNLIGVIFFNIAKVNCFREQDCGSKDNIDLGSMTNQNKSTEEMCSYKFEFAPMYQATQTSARSGRKLNLFEKFLTKVKLLR